MAGHPQPRRITLGGQEAVALTVREYEQLIASRRQIGGQSARMRALSERMRRTEQLLRDLEELVATPTPGRHEQQAAVGSASGQATAESLRHAIAALLRRHRDGTA
ncbi:hypothetical protein ACHBTE_00335 [Streptomyces sp. M41]|uniref:hypothetical protein n=1 Tax=Streptomyces sp. M41 TaxID=3059412 RepID=UPI00374D5FC4